MTSIPASRSARAMILAPRSWPSSPGFATTTRIFPTATISEYTAVKLTIVGCSPAWPNPGGAQSGYLVEGPGRLLLDCGPGVVARLRNDTAWPEVDAIAITHWHLDHWVDLVPWVWGAMFGPGEHLPAPELWIPPGGSDMLSSISARVGTTRMFSAVFEVHEYADGEPFHTA